MRIANGEKDGATVKKAECSGRANKVRTARLKQNGVKSGAKGKALI